MTGHFSLKAAVLLAIASGALGSAQAAPQVFLATNTEAAGRVVDGSGNANPVAQRNLFQAALDPAKVIRETFDQQAIGETVLGTPLNIFGVAATLTPTDGGTVQGSARVREDPYAGGGTFLGRFNSTGDPGALPASPGTANARWWETSAKTTTLNFTNPISTFGLFLTDLGDFDGAFMVDIFDAAGASLYSNTLASVGTNTANGSLTFFGYVGDVTLGKVVFTLNQNCGGTSTPSCDVGLYDFVGFDDLITGPLKNGGTPMPEPTSLALVGLSLGLLGVARRRKVRA